MHDYSKTMQTSAKRYHASSFFAIFREAISFVTCTCKYKRQLWFQLTKMNEEEQKDAVEMIPPKAKEELKEVNKIEMVENNIGADEVEAEPSAKINLVSNMTRYNP